MGARCSRSTDSTAAPPPTVVDASSMQGKDGLKTQERICVGGGCFWCIEAVYRRTQGVIKAESGYMGGHVVNPTYQQVCQGTTGHAEVVNVTFDPTEVSLSELLDIFWQAHDPTQKDGQGNDIGPQYRSCIYYYGDEQLSVVEQSKQDLIKKKPSYAGLVVTEVKRASNFYSAEEYHDDYYAKNPNQGYCRMVVAPKLKKVSHEKYQLAS